MARKSTTKSFSPDGEIFVNVYKDTAGNPWYGGIYTQRTTAQYSIRTDGKTYRYVLAPEHRKKVDLGIEVLP